VRTAVGSQSSAARRQLATWLSRPPSALTLLGAVVVAIALVATGLVLFQGGGSPQTLVWLSLGAVASGLLLAGVAHLRRFSSPGGDGADSRRELLGAVVGALLVLVPLSLTPLTLYLWRTSDRGAIVLLPPLLDRRYLVIGYYLLVLGVPLALLLGARMVSPARAADIPSSTPALEVHQAPARRKLRPLVLVVVAFAFATYFYGPPWGQRPLGGPINYHETVHLTGLQAILHGRLPYIGSASDQYGPVSQLFIFGWMKLIGGFDLSGFREAFAAQHWLAVAFVCVVLLLFLPRRAAIWSLALATLVFPTFQLFGFDPRIIPAAYLPGVGSGYGGLFGWANVWRYSGVLLLGLVLPNLFFGARRSRLQFGALGVVWGLTCLAAQESLLGGAFVTAAVVAALLLSGALQCRDLRSPLLALGAGGAIAGLPVLLFYLAHRELAQFLRNYLLAPVAVSNGWSNTTWWQGGPWHKTYLFLPVFTLLCGLIAVCQLRPLRIARCWCRERAILFGCFSAAAVTQAGAFLRSDTPHLLNVMLVTPVLVGTTAALGGRMLGLRNPASRSLVAVGVFAAGLALLPWSASLPLVKDRLTSPLSGRTAHSDRAADATVLPGLAGRRLGSVYSGLPRCCDFSDVSVDEFVRFANELAMLIGDRTTYVSRSVPDYQPGLGYFMADLRPFDLPLEPTSMAFDRDKVAANLRALADRRRPLDAVVTADPTSDDSRIAIERLGPNPTITRLDYAGKPVQVFVASMSDTTAVPSRTSRIPSGHGTEDSRRS
jgi:hypothetical protein